MAEEKISVDYCDARTTHIRKILERNGPFAHPQFVADKTNIESIRGCKVLVVGAGGLGCELLKDLAMMGFQNIDVIDMDTIDVSNLNRQFLFRKSDVGDSKAEVAAAYINQRIPGCQVTPHCCKIQDKDDSFYNSFNIVVCGLDSVMARRWINAKLCDLLQYDEGGNLVVGSVIPMIDGGTEGFSGNARVVLPGLTACVECTLSLYPPQVNFPMCTIAHTPRLPEHCVEYVRVIQWTRDRPFEDELLDGDNPKHVEWVFRQAEARAQTFGIKGVTHRLTQGVIKHIIPAVASTNAVIAGVCALEVFKMASSSCLPLDNYLNFQDTDGIYCGVVQLEKRVRHDTLEDCPVCSRKPQKLTLPEDAKLRDLIEFLVKSPYFQMANPSIYFRARTLYVPTIPSLEEATRDNLLKSLKVLGISDGSTVNVADATTPKTLEFIIVLTSMMDTRET